MSPRIAAESFDMTAREFLDLVHDVMNQPGELPHIVVRDLKGRIWGIELWRPKTDHLTHYQPPEIQ